MNKLNQATRVLAAVLVLAVSAPLLARAPDSVLAVKGGRFFTGTGVTIDGGVLLVRDGKIAAIGKDVAIPAGARVIDAASCFIMPGLIDAFTTLGTEEPGTLGSDADEKTSAYASRIIDGFNPRIILSSARKANGRRPPGWESRRRTVRPMSLGSGHGATDDPVSCRRAGRVGEAPK
jgi:hypothetical protein